MSNVQESQWFAWWTGVQAAVDHWAHGTLMECPYPQPESVQQEMLKLDLREPRK